MCKVISFFFLLLLNINKGFSMVKEPPTNSLDQENFSTLLSQQGTTIQPITIGEVNGYRVNTFPSEKSQRNHYNGRAGNSVQFLVLNYTVSNFLRAMDIFTKDLPDGRVSEHYVITQSEPENNITSGALFQVVPENENAWHSGESFWNGVRQVNQHSIGVTAINQGFIGTENDPNIQQWFAFEDQQIETLGKLCQQLVQTYHIKPQNVVGHGDVAPLRKHGPGILFPWEKLYTAYGVGAWLTMQERDPQYIAAHFSPTQSLPSQVDEAFFLSCLRGYGYDIPTGAVTIDSELAKVLRNFKAHFSCNQSPEKFNSALDYNDMVWAWGLEAKYKN